MPLPVPVGRQAEVLYLSPGGHTVVLGTAGSGKTTLAVLRSAYLADRRTTHHGKTLLLTFNRALVTYLKYLASQELQDVLVESYHQFAVGYLSSRGKMSIHSICKEPDRSSLIAEAVHQVSQRNGRSIFKRPTEFYSDEIRWIAGHGISSADSYESVERTGRSGARIDRSQRRQMFEVYETYRSLRSQGNRDYDYDDIASAVVAEFDVDTSPRRYKHVVIDEGQDFTPEMLRSLSKAVPPDGSLTLFGDMAQQIYGHRMSWRSAGLRVRRTWEFAENYRNSRQIARLALAISRMAYFSGAADLVEPTSPSADGPLPTVVQCPSGQQEIVFATRQALAASAIRSVAILTPDRQDESLIRARCPRATRLHRDMRAWQAGAGIWYGTFHSAKGLEFDIVFLLHCSKDRLPNPKDILAFGSDDAAAEAGRLLYVGVTRAKSRLVLVCSGEVTELLPKNPDNLSPQTPMLYQVTTA